MSARVHPSAWISDGVTLGKGTVVGPFSVVLGPCSIGKDVWIGPHVVIGTPPEHRDHGKPVAWEGEIDGIGVEIGDRVLLREHSTIHQGTERPTRVGDDCYLMSRSHVGHDNHLVRAVTVSPGASVAGHSTIGEEATLGMGSMIHQRVSVGPGAMVGMGTAVRRLVQPFTTVVGNPGRLAGVNEVALRRLGAPEELIRGWPNVLTGEVEVGAGAAPRIRAVLDRWSAMHGADPDGARRHAP